MDEPSVSFSLSALVAAVATIVSSIAATFVKIWINAVNARLDSVEDDVALRATSEKVSGVESRVHDVEKEMVRKEDLRRLEDKWDVRFDKMDAKLDRVITLVAKDKVV